MAEETKNNDSSFNKEFCVYLENHLGETFRNSKREDVKGYWCDEIYWKPNSEDQLRKKSVNDTRRITTTAWLGKEGQDTYEMTIKFGKYSLRRYARSSPIIDCIPSKNSMDWIDIDTQNKKIEIRLT